MIALVDADSIPYTICHNKKDVPEKTLEECIQGSNNYLNSLCNAVDATHVHLFFTLSKGFRYDIYPDYKANRKGLVKPNYFYETRDYLVKEYKGISHSKLEADDILTIYKNKYINELKDYIVISKDKDINNLFGKNYNIEKNTMRVVMTSHELEYFWKSVIIGDQTDNIKGIPRKGKAFANKLYKECLDIKDQDKTFKKFEERIKEEYNKYYGSTGELEFTKNYTCLKILDSYEGIEFQEPISIKDIYARTLGVVG